MKQGERDVRLFGIRVTPALLGCGCALRHLFRALQQTDHGVAHCCANVHVGLGILAVVSPRGAGRVLERVGVHRSNAALELGVLCSVGDILHCIKDQTTAILGTLHRLSQRCSDELCAWRIVLEPELFDELDEVCFVEPGHLHVPRVAVTLPPEEACDLVAAGAGVERGEVLQDFACTKHVAIILDARVPADWLWRGPLDPPLRAVVVASVDVRDVVLGELGPRAAWWEQVPTQRPVAGAAFQGHDRFGGVSAESKPDAKLGPKRAFGLRLVTGKWSWQRSRSSHELVVPEGCAVTVSPVCTHTSCIM